jgi:hypothetical protein
MPRNVRLGENWDGSGSLGFRNDPNRAATPDLSCELKWSAQHLREVYSRESESPKSFAGVDLDAARSRPVGIAYSRKVGSLLQVLSQQAVRVFVCSSLPGAVRITEVHFHIRGHREGFVFGHLQPDRDYRELHSGDTEVKAFCKANKLATAMTACRLVPLGKC